MSEKEKRDGSAHIVGLGAQTPLGRTAFSSATAVLSGLSRHQMHPFYCDRASEPFRVVAANYLPTHMARLDRLVELAVGAAREALASVEAFELAETDSIPLILGIPAAQEGASTGLEEELRRRLSQRLKETTRISSIRIVATGHAAGLMAVGEAQKLVAEGHVPLCLAGGVDSYLDRPLLKWLDEQKRVNTEYSPLGFFPGEAAGFCMLAGEPLPSGWRTFGRIESIATAQEENLIGTESVCVGEGLSTAWKHAFEALPAGETVALTICDMNGEPYRVDELGFSLAKFSERFEAPPSILTPAGSWGDVGAASGPLFVALALVARNIGYSKGDATLVWTSSDSGERTAAIVTCESQTRMTSWE